MPRRYTVRVGRGRYDHVRTLGSGLAVVDGVASSGGGSFSFPTFATTGPRVSMTTVTSTTVSSGSSHSAKHFVNGLDLTGIDNVSFTDCKIDGRLELSFGSQRARDFYWCEVDGDSFGTGGAIGGYGGRFYDCRVWNAGHGWSAGGGLMHRCFVGELYLLGETHGEAIIVFGDDLDFYRCTLLGQYRSGGNQTTPGGGISAALAMYTHGSTWGPHSSVDLRECLLSAPDANTVVYWGTPGSGDDPLTNCNATDNTVRKAPGSSTGSSGNGSDFVTNYGGGSGNSVTGNVYEDSGLPCGGND